MQTPAKITATVNSMSSSSVGSTIKDTDADTESSLRLLHCTEAV